MQKQTRTLLAALTPVVVSANVSATVIFGDPADFELSARTTEDVDSPTIVVGKDATGSINGAAGASAIFPFDISSLDEDVVLPGSTANFFYSLLSGSPPEGDLWFVGFSASPDEVPSTVTFLADTVDAGDTAPGFADGVERLAAGFVTTSTPQGQYLSADVTALLNARPAGAAGDTVWFRINPSSGAVSGGNNFAFATADAQGTDTDPFLNVVIPEPTTGVSLLGGLGLLFGRRRR